MTAPPAEPSIEQSIRTSTSMRARVLMVPTVVCEVVGAGGAGEPRVRLECHHAGRRVGGEGSPVGAFGPLEVGLGVGGGLDVVVEDRDLHRLAEGGRGLIILGAGCGRRVGDHRRQHAHRVGAAVVVDSGPLEGVDAWGAVLVC